MFWRLSFLKQKNQTGMANSTVYNEITLQGDELSE